MDFSNISSYATQISSILAGLSLVYAILFKRHLFLIFFWHKYLSKDFNSGFDKNLESHIKNKINLEKLKLFFPKFKFNSIKEANAKLDWCVKNKINYDDAGLCSQCIEYTDSYPNPVTFKKPRTYKADIIVTGIFGAFLLAAMIMLALLPNISGTSGSIWVTIKKSSTYAEILKDGTFKSLFSDTEWQLTASSCKTNPTKPSSNIPLNDSQYIEMCTFISDKKEVDDYFKETVSNLIKAEITLLPPNLFLLFVMYRSLLRSVKIKEIDTKVNRPPAQK